MTRFNSRTPGGVRQFGLGRSILLDKFQFTHPGRGATVHDFQRRQRRTRFNSRTPGGVRLNVWLEKAEIAKFQFTHPGRGATALWRTLLNCL